MKVSIDYYIGETHLCTIESSFCPMVGDIFNYSSKGKDRKFKVIEREYSIDYTFANEKEGPTQTIDINLEELN